VAAPHATGPVDYVPGPPAAGSPAPGPGTAATVEAAATPGVTREFLVDLSDSPSRPRRSRPGARTGALLLGAVAAVALELGLLMRGAGSSLWSSTPLWSAFASLAVVAGLAGVAARLAGGRPSARPVALAGLAGLGAFWLLVALPTADTDRGFLLTAALGCLIGAVWLTGRAEVTPPSPEEAA
jgi:hypothetical protein